MMALESNIEENVPMHQCAISAKDIKQHIIWDLFFLAMNSSCWYSLPHWGFCPPGTGEICRRPTDRREVNEGGVKTIEGRGEATMRQPRTIYHLAMLVLRYNISLAIQAHASASARAWWWLSK